MKISYIRSRARTWKYVCLSAREPLVNEIIGGGGGFQNMAAEEKKKERLFHDWKKKKKNINIRLCVIHPRLDVANKRSIHETRLDWKGGMKKYFGKIVFHKI